MVLLNQLAHLLVRADVLCCQMGCIWLTSVSMSQPKCIVSEPTDKVYVHANMQLACSLGCTARQHLGKTHSAQSSTEACCSPAILRPWLSHNDQAIALCHRDGKANLQYVSILCPNEGMTELLDVVMQMLSAGVDPVSSDSTAKPGSRYKLATECCTTREILLLRTLPCTTCQMQ